MKITTRILLSAAALLISTATFAQSGHAEQLRASYEGKQAKYIFLFIGDGMGMAHVNAAEAFVAAGKNNITMNTLNMSGFEVQSFMTTYSQDRFITGSAASGTAIATGHKTTTGTISMDSDHKKNYKTIAEKAKDNGYKVGILTSVPINHATPAVFYAHVPVRHNYYSIGKQLPLSGFDFFGGGAFQDPTGKKDDKQSLIAFAEEHGYTYLDNKREIKRLSPDDGPVIAVNPNTSEGAMPYAIDMTREDIPLADFTGKAIEMLDNDEGFFMMVEGGKIDWAGHDNDAASIVYDMMDFDNAVGDKSGEHRMLVAKVGLVV
jgi:alkaline phosphatase